MTPYLKKSLEEFREQYQEAYRGILAPEVLAGGNAWFETFLTTFHENYRALIKEKLEEKKRLGNAYPMMDNAGEVQRYNEGYDKALSDALSAIEEL